MNKKILFLLSLIICATVLPACSNVKADTVIYGNIYTANKKDDVVKSIAIKDSKIVYAGNAKGVKKFIGDSTKIEKYSEDKLITPSLIDGHTHVTQILVAQCDSLGSIASGASKSECISTIENYVNDNPNLDFYILSGWEMQNFSDEEYGCPTASMIDDITTKPILAYSSDGHTFWTNTPLMQMAGVNKDTTSPVGGEVVKDSEGNPLGIFKDQAQGYIEAVKPGISQSAYDNGIVLTDNTWLEQGYASRFDALGNVKSNPRSYSLISQLEKKDKEGLLSTYVQSSFVIYDTDDAMDLVDVAISLRDETKGGNHEMTSVKLFLDGIIENAGAYLVDPYSSVANGTDNYYGTPIWPGDDAVERMSKIIAKANKAGLPCHFHCMGDKATSDALNAIKLAAKQIGKRTVKKARNAIAHLALVQDGDYARFRKYGVVAVLNPWMNKDPGYYDLLQVPYLGEDRAEKQYPAKKFLENKVKISFGTDMGASFTFNSVECFHSLVTRTYNNDEPSTLLNASERLSRCEAIKAMTSGAAYQLHKEKEFGSIEVGKDASLCIFSKDLLNIADSQIMETSVENTMVKGHWFKA